MTTKQIEKLVSDTTPIDKLVKVWEEYKERIHQDQQDFDLLTQSLAKRLGMSPAKTPVPQPNAHDGPGSRGGFAHYAIQVLQDGRKRKPGQIIDEARELGWTSSASSAENTRKVAYQALRSLRESGQIQHGNTLYWIDWSLCL